MTVTHVEKDAANLRMTITAELDATVERAWELWADPRQLERWWGPPMWPATVTEHDLREGGTVRYFMTGPEGERSGGWWKVQAVEAPTRLSFEDGFAGDDGQPNPEMPTMVIRVALDERTGGGTRMAVTTTFPSAEVMEQMITMGMEEGMAAGLGQIDAILAEDVAA